MLQKVNQSEELLHDQSSEYDSVDLSERHLQEEQARLASRAFSNIKTMNSINIRHESDEGLHA